MVEVGKTAYMRTSNEGVYVLGTKELEPNANSFPQCGSTVAAVRRPVAGENGLYHVVEYYYLDELVTLEQLEAERDEQQRRFNERVNKARKEAGLDEPTLEANLEPLPN